MDGERDRRELVRDDSVANVQPKVLDGDIEVSHVSVCMAGLEK